MMERRRKFSRCAAVFHERLARDYIREGLRAQARQLLSEELRTLCVDDNFWLRPSFHVRRQSI
jgi:hypothetical protein